MAVATRRGSEGQPGEASAAGIALRAARPITSADVMRAQDVADLTGIPKSTVYQYAREGRLPSRRRGRHLLFLRFEVEHWLHAADPHST